MKKDKAVSDRSPDKHFKSHKEKRPRQRDLEVKKLKSVRQNKDTTIEYPESNPQK